MLPRQRASKKAKALFAVAAARPYMRRPFACFASKIYACKAVVPTASAPKLPASVVQHHPPAAPFRYPASRLAPTLPYRTIVYTLASLPHTMRPMGQSGCQLRENIFLRQIFSHVLAHYRTAEPRGACGSRHVVLHIALRFWGCRLFAP